MNMTRDFKTFCIGRMLVDLPERLVSLKPADGSLDMSEELRLDGMLITTRTGVSFQAFQDLVDARWAELQVMEQGQSAAALAAPPQYHPIRENGGLFSFNQKSISYNARVVNGVKTADYVTVNDAEAYFWDKGTLFTIKDGGYDTVNQKIAEAMARMSYLAPGQMPEQAGICLQGGFIAQHYGVCSEQYIGTISAPYFTFLIRHTEEVDGVPLLEQFGPFAPMIADVEDDWIEGGIVFRAAERTQDHLPAQELVTGYTQGVAIEGKGVGDFTTDVEARWEFVGQETPDPQPLVHAELVLSVDDRWLPDTLGEYPEQIENSAVPTKKAFFDMWDAVASNIRFYPGALAPAPKGAEPLLLGPSDAQRMSNRQALDDFLGEMDLRGISGLPEA